jgi:hypothetical protein
MSKNKESIKKHMMTLEDHRELGKILQEARNMLIKNSIKLANVYGKTEKSNLKLEKAAYLIDEVRSLLDDKLFKEYPDLDSDEGCRYYYPRC